MKILPKFLFLFQTIPVLIGKSFVSLLIQTISTFMEEIIYFCAKK